MTTIRFLRLLSQAATAMLTLAVPVFAQEQVPPELFQGMKWRNIGPFRGGRSVAVAGVGSDHRVYYFGGVGSGVWKTTDAGQTWANISDSTFKTSSVGAIAVSQSDPNVVYVGMGEHAVRGVMTSHGDGLYKSTDAGRSWKHLGLGRTRQISAVKVHPGNPDVLYVAAQGAPYGPTEERGIYRSTDGGDVWDKVLYVNETSGPSSLSIDRNNPRVLYAGFWDHLRLPWQVRSGGEGSGIYRSGDGGDTWEKLTDGFPDLMGKTAVAVSANSDRIYALIEADPGGGLFRSDDGGRTWRNVNESWTLRARAWYYMHLHADPQNPDVVWVLNAPVMKSIDGGLTFSRVRTPHGDNHDLWINPNNSQYLINANDGGANVSLNGGETWSTQQNQPTSQFYRVNTDNRFPYYIYGGQQDNSSVAIASQAPGGVGWKDWHAVAGCESAYVAFDPDDPVRNYGGCYMGQIAEYDEVTRSQRNVMAYPWLPAALASRDMKYRFNWNAPILVSQHDPSVIYHAANVLLKSSDRGRTWVEISPDLTRDEDDEQGPGGGPITNEGAGGEIYNTIMYVAESPHDPLTIWVGSDDGLVHVTRDGGASWEDATPGGLAEGIINAIEVSPHEPAAAYVAYSRYKYNDFTPYIFKTADYGAHWERVVNGIAGDAHVRVVREDPIRRGLLYAGTEAGVYVSWDDGGNWQSLQLNMPLTPITDLKVQVQHNDLVAATGGRGFWILDDLSPLQQVSAGLTESDVHLFRPRPAFRVAGGGFGQAEPVAGENAPQGAIVDFYLADVADSVPVALEFLDGAGDVVRAFSSQKGEEVDSSSLLEAKAGHNRFAWDLRRESVKNVPGLYVWGTLRGGRIIPGDYTVRLTSGGGSVTESLEVLSDPRIEATQSGFREQDQLVDAVATELEQIHETVVKLRSVRDQIEALNGRIEDEPGSERVIESGEALVERITALEDSLVQRRTVDGQTVINFPSRLNFHFIYLLSAVENAEGVVTQGARETFSDLQSQWAVYRAQCERLLGEDLEEFNALVAQAGVGAITLPRP